MGDLDDLAAHFAPLIMDPPAPAKRGPQNKRGIIAQTSTQRVQRHRAPIKEARRRCLAVIDMETDPFTEDKSEIRPFCWEIYSDQFDRIVDWDTDPEALLERLVETILSLPDEYTIYAHNGGKFDFMFFIHKLRGVQKFKGRAIMRAKLGNHELRDSLHILPERLSAWKKDKFDYAKMTKKMRQKHKGEILEYLHSDCVYLFDIVKRFVSEFGLKLSIGQAAFTELRKSYKVAHVNEKMDEALRTWFFGGRVECIAGRGIFDRGRRNQPYKLYDVNSMYPYVMATRRHPISDQYLWRRGDIGADTIFIDLTCRNYGAFVSRGENNEASAECAHGRFKTTIWEYEIAIKHDLIEDVQIHWVVDCLERSDFSKFINPMYNRRQETKEIMKPLERAGKQLSYEYEETKKENILLKYLLNNSYGKFAQNPRKFKDFCYTSAGENPLIYDPEWFDFLDETASNYADMKHRFGMPVERNEVFEVWARPSPGRRFNNVGTAASITGAARSVLLDARQCAIDPIYCDTDSLICRELSGFELDPVKLGAWDLEETFDEVIITGKKQYACKVTGKDDCAESRLKVRCKGADLRVVPGINGIAFPDPTPEQWKTANAQTWGKYVSILEGQVIEALSKAPTIDKVGRQRYITRRIRSTAPAPRAMITRQDRRSHGV